MVRHVYEYDEIMWFVGAYYRQLILEPLVQEMAWHLFDDSLPIYPLEQIARNLESTLP